MFWFRLGFLWLREVNSLCEFEYKKVWIQIIIGKHFVTSTLQSTCPEHSFFHSFQESIHGQVIFIVKRKPLRLFFAEFCEFLRKSTSNAATWQLPLLSAPLFCWLCLRAESDSEHAFSKFGRDINILFSQF